MKNVTSLAYHIELNRQRLAHAVATNNVDLMFRTQTLLAQLHAAYFNETVKVEKTAQPKTKRQELYFLVFSESNQDGVVLSATEYRELYKSMDQFDRETHQKIEVDASMREEVANVLNSDSDSAKSKVG